MLLIINAKVHKGKGNLINSSNFFSSFFASLLLEVVFIILFYFIFLMKVVFKTYGCSNNFSESEAMAGLLEREGYLTEESENFSSADAVIFNLCSVKGPSVNHCLNSIKKLKRNFPEKKVVVAGCIPVSLIPRIKRIDKGINLINTHNIQRVSEVINSCFQNQAKEFVSFERKVKLNLPKKRVNSVVGIVPILSGCNDFCSYCSTKLIKGSTFSYPKESILREVKESLRQGCKEIWLTSQDNGAYQTEKGRTQLPELIKDVASIKGNFFVRVGMANPTYILDCLNELIEAMKNDKIFKFLHVPVQSGNNRILKKMKRRYAVKDYKKIINEFKKEIPEITIATDIIVGFPTEKRKEFNDSLNLIKETKPDVLNISRFQPRPFTLASRMKQLKGSVIKGRSRKLTSLFHEISLANNKKWIGKTCKVLIDEKGKKENQSIGRNSSYKQVLFNEKIPLGKIIKAEIISAEKFYLLGKPIKEIK
jgi:MiaB-like tRNA modifying enzyme